MGEEIRMTMTNILSLNFKERLLALLLCLLHHLNPSFAYSLKNCTIDYSDNSLADVFVDCSSRALVTVPNDIPKHVSSVKLNYNLLVKVNRGDFGNLSKLKILDLHLNQIAHIDDGSFIHLGALATLNMNKNQLTNLTANLFQGLSNLTTLDLSQNSIQFIHTSAFQFLTNLHTVMLDTNKLQHIIDIQPILQLPHIKELNIKDNLFSSFETKDLHVSSGLKVLHVSGEKMKKFSITTPIFPLLEMIDLSQSSQVGVLKWLITDETLLRNITQLFFCNVVISFEEIQKVLQSLDSLAHLRLNYMEKLINKGLLATVCKIPTLRRLELFWNKVTNLSTKLETCSQLSELDLSDTYMTELSKGSVRSMERLKSLKVQANLLTKVPGDIRSLSFLEILNLDGNLISELGCDDFTNTTHLTELYLKTNRITKLNSCVFENLNYMNVLDISDNLLSILGDTFKLGPTRLTFLDLSKNVVPVFDKSGFQGLVSLKHLNVVSNRNGHIDKNAFDRLNNLEILSMYLPSEAYYNFTGLAKLEILSVYVNPDISWKHPDPNNSEAFNHLKSLKVFSVIGMGDHLGYLIDIMPQTFESMRYLEDFTADSIYISKLDLDTFQFNSHLKNLTIRHSDLSDLDPELFQPIPNLKVLDLSNSKLKSLDFLFHANLSALRYLKLTDNEITVINETVFQSLPALTYLDLGNNPFTCDCSNAGFIQWVISNSQTQVVNAHQYTCSFPVAQQGRKLLDFDIVSCWMDFSLLCFISSSGLVVLTLLSSLIYHFLRWRLAYVFYIFMAFVSNTKRRKTGAPHQFDAFISYSVHDEAWVYREMLPVLEGEQGWRLCLHHRDFQPGKPIMENIADAIYSSRKTICVITWNYLKSEWCSREIQMASFRLFDEQKDVLILLFLEEIPAQQLSPYYRMRKLVKKRTYLSWPQAEQHTGVFWQNVRRALETGDAPTDTNLVTGPAQC